MKIVYYGFDGEAAHAKRAELHKAGEDAIVNDAHVFSAPQRGAEPVFMPDVPEWALSRISKAYGVDMPEMHDGGLTGVVSGAPGSVEIAPVQPFELPMTDDELREAIKAATGKAPHWKAKRETLEARWRGINNGS